MIVVTGAAGFIGSYLIGFLNQEGYYSIVAVDDFNREDKKGNLEGKSIAQKINRSDLPHFIDENEAEIEFVFHLGARTDTTEFDRSLLKTLNTDYSIKVWELCTKYQIPLVYASSAATYGLGLQGYGDDESLIPSLKPLNPYGDSKQEFDLWVLKQKKSPFFWAGLKFFNVYGPNEYHKGRMASVILHAYRQISQSGKMKLFRSHHPDFKDGEQKRDFIYVKDVARVCLWLMETRKKSGIYNLGSGTARTFLDLVNSVFHNMGIDPDIDFIDTPADIRDKYQYFTEAQMTKLFSSGYPHSFSSLEEGIADYMEYLKQNKYF